MCIKTNKWPLHNQQYRQFEFSSKHSLVTGRTICDVRILITQLRTCPSRATFTSIILPNGHWPLGMLTSATSTMSPLRSSAFALIHFCRAWSAGKYSRTHLLQNTEARYCTCLHQRLEYTSFTNTPEGILELDFINNSMLGVKSRWILRIAAYWCYRSVIYNPLCLSHKCL